MKKLAVFFALCILSFSITGCAGEYNPDQSSHNHTYSSDWSYDDEYHWHQATCEHKELYKDKEKHTFDDWIVDVAPTYSSEGSKHHVCKVCSYSATKSIDKLVCNHVPGEPVQENVINPTCTDDGRCDLVTYCQECGEELEREDNITLPATGHNNIKTREENRIEATCLENGSYTLVTYCEDDNFVISTENRTIAALGHNFEFVEEKHASYEYAGYKLYKCSRCEATKTESNGEDILPHHYSSEWSKDINGHWHACTDEGYEEYKSDFEKHDYEDDDWIADVIPTDSLDGTKYRECYGCGYVEVGVELSNIKQSIEDLIFRLSDDETHYIVEKYTGTRERVFVPGVYNDLPVKVIEEDAFEFNSEIKYIHVGEGVEEIKYHAFNSYSVEEIDLPSTVEKLEPGFITCSYTQYINVDESNLNYCSVDGVLFSKDMKTLVKYPTGFCGPYYVPSGVNTIESYAFDRYVPKITLPSSLTTIKDNAFTQSPTYIINKSSLPITVGSDTYGGIALKSETVSTSDSSGIYVSSGFCYRVFSGSEKKMLCHCSHVEEATIPDAFTSIDVTNTGVFHPSNRLKTLNIGDKLTDISGSFYNVPYLENINVSSSNKIYKSIDGVLYTRPEYGGYIKCFPNAREGKFELPDAVGIVYGHCPNIDEIYVSYPNANLNNFFSNLKSAFPNVKKIDGVEGNTYSIKDNAVYSKDFKELWYVAPKQYSKIIVDERVETFKSGAIHGYCGRAIELPDTLKTLESSALRWNSIKEITIPESITTLPNYCFELCPRLKKVTLHNKITSYGESLFNGCGLTSLPDLPNLKTITKYMFGGTSIETLDLSGTSVTKIDVGAFGNCKYLTSVIFNDKSITLGDQAFEACQSLVSADLKGTTSIGDKAFYNCISLETLSCPKALSIGDRAFLDCSKLANISPLTEIVSIKERAFAGCDMEEITFGKKLSTIGVGCFLLCSNLKTINYAKTKAEFEAITKGDQWCDYTYYTLTIVCSNGSITITPYPYKS